MLLISQQSFYLEGKTHMEMYHTRISLSELIHRDSTKKRVIYLPLSSKIRTDGLPGTQSKKQCLAVKENVFFV